MLNLPSGLMELMKLPLTREETLSIQAIAAFDLLVFTAPRQFITCNYLPALQKISEKHSCGKWVIDENTHQIHLELP